MKALVFHGPADIRYESFEDPGITDNRNMVIKVERCSICGSDLHMYHGDKIGPFDYSQPMDHFCTGHEAIGEVMEVGAAVRNHKVGDRVLVAGGTGCGECRRCRAGQVSICENPQIGKTTAYGISAGLQGVHADFLEVYNADLGAHAIPEGVTDEQALLLTDALATGYHGVKSANISAGDVVAVIGQGPVGLMAAEAALASGAAKVYAIDPQESRRNMAARFGGIPLDPANAVATIKEDTHGLGIDAVIEAVGLGPTLIQAVKLLRPGGRLAVLGILQPDTPIPLAAMQGKSITTFMGIAGVVDGWPDLIPLLQSGRIRAEGVFSHAFDLADGAEAFRMFNAREDGVIKTMITP